MATEAWLRGPIPGVTPLLMPVAHAIVQAADDAEGAAAGLGPEELWARPGGAAAVGFHLRHIAGVLDRLFTYARGEALSAAQLRALEAEGDPGTPPAAASELIGALRGAVERALEQLRATPADGLLEPRGVGRKQVPSNVIGLLFHAAEHAQRHTGQIVATAKVVRGQAAERAGAPRTGAKP
ncbi:MAG TPA: DinB family protein [Longimicrobiales bacterium]|nr:DinB family protein [Longimicrobiales bacterium]